MNGDRNNPARLTSQTTVKTHRIMAFSLAALLACASVNATENNHFLSSIGTISQSDAEVRTVVAATAGTNAQPDVSITWRTGGATSADVKPMTHAGWFAFLEQPNRIWIFDGDVLNLVERHGVTVIDSSDVSKGCPDRVRDALPEKIRRKYFK